VIEKAGSLEEEVVFSVVRPDFDEVLVGVEHVKGRCLAAGAGFPTAADVVADADERVVVADARR
jgi:hypothetical protein